MENAAAQLQIKVLAGAEDVRVEGSWLQLARCIDTKGLLRAPSLTRVHDSPAIALIEGMATPAMCRWLIQRADSRLGPARIGDCATGKGAVDPILTGLAAGFGLADRDTALAMTQKRLELASGLEVLRQEAPHALSYAVGQDYKARFDFFAPGEPAFQHALNTMGQQIGACLTGLNDDYEGGETAFPRINWKHRGKPVDSMLFLNVRTSDQLPDAMTLQAGMPVTAGRKWLLSLWVSDKVQPIV